MSEDRQNEESDQDFTGDVEAPPQPSAPPQADPYISARLAGYSWPEIDGHIEESTQAALAAGYSKPEIDAFLGRDGANTLATSLAFNRPEELPPPSETPAPLEQNVKDLYADAIKDGTAADHTDFAGALGSEWGADPLTQQQIAAQLPDPRHLLDMGIELAHATGSNIIEGAKAARDNILNYWTNLPQAREAEMLGGQGGSWNEQKIRQDFLSDPLLADAATQPDGIASATDAKNQEEAEKLRPTLTDLSQEAGRDAINHAVFPAPMLWMDPETVWGAMKGIYNLPRDQGAWQDKKEQDRLAGKDVSEYWKDSPAFNLVAQILLFGAAHKAAALGKEAVGAVPEMLVDETGGPGKKFTMRNDTPGAVGTHLYSILDEEGKNAGGATISVDSKDPTSAHITYVYQGKEYTPPGEDVAARQNQFGPSTIRDLARQYFADHPDIQQIEGTRITGARVTTGSGSGKMVITREQAMPKPVEPVLKTDHIPTEVLDTMRAPDGTLDANKIAMSMGEQAKGKAEAKPAEEPRKDTLTEAPPAETKIEINGETLTRKPDETVQDFTARAHAAHTKAEVEGSVNDYKTAPLEPAPPLVPPPGVTMPDQTPWVKELDTRIRMLGKNARASENATLRVLKGERPEWLMPEMEKKVRDSIEMKLGADDVDAVKHAPDVQEVIDAHKALTDEQHELAVRQTQLLLDKTLEPEELLGLRTVDQGHVHRIVKGEENLGPELSRSAAIDPITGVRPSSRSLSKWDPGMMSRSDMYVLEDAKGNREWGKTKLDELGKEQGLSLKMGDTVDFHDGRSGTWKIKPARVSEIEANTPLRYRGGFIGPLLQDVATRRAVVDHLEFTRDMSPRLKEAGLFVPEGTKGGVPEGWVKVDLPQMRGWMPPRIARPLNNFHQLAMERGDILPGLVAANHYMISTLFFSPMMHLRNEAAHFVPSRGSQWLNPMGWARMMYYGRQALHDVATLGPGYERVLTADGALMASSTRSRNIVQTMWQSHLHEVVEDKGGLWSQVAKYSGFSSAKALADWQWSNSAKILWGGGDIMRQTRILELENRDKIGVGGGRQRTLAEAVAENKKTMPPYEIGSEVMGSAKLAETMKSPLLWMFGRYAHGRLANLYHDIRDLAGPSRTPFERSEAAGRVVAFSAMYYGMAQLGMYAGGATLIHGAQQLFAGEKRPEDIAKSWWVTSSILKAFNMVHDNADAFGQEIWRQGGTTFGNIVNSAEAGIGAFPLGQNLLDLFKEGGPSRVALKFLGWDQAKPAVDPEKKAKWDKHMAAVAAAAENKDDVETFLRNFANEHLGTSIEAPPAPVGRGSGGGTRTSFGATRGSGGGGGGGAGTPGRTAAQGYDPGGIVLRGGGTGDDSLVAQAPDNRTTSPRGRTRATRRAGSGRPARYTRRARR